MIVLGGSARTLGNMNRAHHRRERGEARGEEDPADHDPGEEQERPAIGLRGGDGGGLRRLGQGRLRLGVFLAGGGLGRDGGTGGGRPLLFGGPGRGGGRDLLGLLRPGLAQRLGQVLRDRSSSPAAAASGRRRGLGRGGGGRLGRRRLRGRRGGRGRGASRPRGRQLLLQRQRPAERRGRGRHRGGGLGTEVRLHDDRRLALRRRRSRRRLRDRRRRGTAGPRGRQLLLQRQRPAQTGGRRGRDRGGASAPRSGSTTTAGSLSTGRRLRDRRRRGTAGPRPRASPSASTACPDWRASGRPPPARPGPRPIRTPRPASAPEIRRGRFRRRSSPSGFAGPPRRAAARMSFTLGRSAIGQLSLSQNRGPLGEGLYRRRSGSESIGPSKAKAVPQVRTRWSSLKSKTLRVVSTRRVRRSASIPESRIRSSRLPDRENTRPEADLGSLLRS